MERGLLSRRAALIGLGLIAADTGTLWAAAVYPRRLDLKNAHTRESFSGPYRDEWGPLPDAMEDLSVFLRDHHTNTAAPVDIDTLDFLADVLAAAGQKRATILSAYRTKATNEKLRRTLFGVAERSHHMYGRALDFTLEAKLADAKSAARALRRGGVGWYPTSHFIHLDTGPVRNWDLGGGDLQKLFVSRVPLNRAPPKPISAKARVARLRALARQQFLDRSKVKR